MFNDLDPREKKALIIFFAILALIVTYLGTHDISFEKPASSLQESTDFSNPEPIKQQSRSYESYL